MTAPSGIRLSPASHLAQVRGATSTCRAALAIDRPRLLRIFLRSCPFIPAYPRLSVPVKSGPFLPDHAEPKSTWPLKSVPCLPVHTCPHGTTPRLACLTLTGQTLPITSVICPNAPHLSCLTHPLSASIEPASTDRTFAHLPRRTSPHQAQTHPAIPAISYRITPERNKPILSCHALPCPTRNHRAGPLLPYPAASSASMRPRVLCPARPRSG